MLFQLKACCAALIAALLSACGAGGGSAISSAPTPPAAPTSSQVPPPATASPPPPPLQPNAIALKSDQPFVTFGVTETDLLSPSRNSSSGTDKDTGHITASQPSSKADLVDFRYDQSTGQYAITFPDGTGGQLSLIYLNGSSGQIADSTGHSVTGPNGDLGVVLTLPVPSRPDYQYSYSHFGDWNKFLANADGSAVQTYGLFAYGQQTPSSAVPRTGSARYFGEIVANSPMDAWLVGGTVELAFDFGAGSLGGYIHPVFNTNGWYPDFDHDYGRYDFTQTVYSSGSARYSGAFARGGTALPNSWFDGSLTGPNGEEAIGRFVAPFTRDGKSGALTGIWITKKN